MRQPTLLALTLMSFAMPSATPSTTGADWPQFRGPGGRCLADDTAIPVHFGPDQAVRWKADLPPGHSSPCVVGDVVVVTGFEDGASVVVALDRVRGTERWRRTFEGPAYPEYFHVDAVPALPSAASDGERVVVYFGNYGLVALDLDGEIQWEHRLPHPGYGFGVGNSPLLVDGVVVLARDGAPEAAILAFDLEDGEEIWRIDRFNYGEAHASPFLWRHEDRDELVIAGTNRLCSYDPSTRELLWTVEGLTVFPCTTPVADDETLYFAAWSTPNSSGRSSWEEGYARSLELSDAEIADPKLLFARLDRDGDGRVVRDELPECRAKDAFHFLDKNRDGGWDVDEMVGRKRVAPGKNVMVAVARGASGDASADHVRWTWTRVLPYVSSPLVYRGRVWLVKSGGVVAAVDAATGEPIIDRGRLSDRSEYYMSPVGAAGHILIGSAEGTMYVLDADADELVVEHEVHFNDELFATPAVVDGVVYLRSKSALWTFGVGE